MDFEAIGFLMITQLLRSLTQCFFPIADKIRVPHFAFEKTKFTSVWKEKITVNRVEIMTKKTSLNKIQIDDRINRRESFFFALIKISWNLNLA